MSAITTVVGNLGRDPKLRDVNGRPVCGFSVADDIRIRKADGEWGKETRWYNISVWGKRAESCGSMLSKGSKVQIVGEVTLREWTDDNGNLRTEHEIDAWNVLFLSDFGRGRTETSGATEANDDVPF
jgi:single-strand DNA-binding protein